MHLATVWPLMCEGMDLIQEGTAREGGGVVVIDVAFNRTREVVSEVDGLRPVVGADDRLDVA